jgi:hypothetical protein
MPIAPNQQSITQKPEEASPELAPSRNGFHKPEELQELLPTFTNPDALKYWRVFEKMHGECLFFSREMNPHLAPKYRYLGGTVLRDAMIQEWKDSGIAVVINKSKRKDQQRLAIRFIKRPPSIEGTTETLSTTITNAQGLIVDPLDEPETFFSLFKKPAQGKKATLFLDWRGCKIAIFPRTSKQGHWWRLNYNSGEVQKQSTIGFPTEQLAVADVLIVVKEVLR